MVKIKKFYFMFFILVSCMGCDQISKLVAKNSLEKSPPVTYLGETIRLQYAENTGAFLSLGSGLPKVVRTWLFTILSGALLIGLFFYIIYNRDLGKYHIFALSLILGGGSSNMIDRILNDGKVIDFLNVGIGSLRTGIFNIADALIMTGMGLIIFSHIKWRRESDSPSEQDVNS